MYAAFHKAGHPSNEIDDFDVVLFHYSNYCSRIERFAKLIAKIE